MSSPSTASITNGDPASEGLLRPALMLFVLLSLLTGIVYPLVVTGVAQLAWSDAANGSLIVRDGRLVGSRPGIPGRDLPGELRDRDGDSDRHGNRDRVRDHGCPAGALARSDLPLGTRGAD